MISSTFEPFNGISDQTKKLDDNAIVVDVSWKYIPVHNQKFMRPTVKLLEMGTVLSFECLYLYFPTQIICHINTFSHIVFMSYENISKEVRSEGESATLRWPQN